MPESTSLAELIAGLSEPAAYPHAVRGLRVLQTHTSCVFLTGDYVYKVKKPVDFGFLDYSSVRKRRQCCDRELILNRRLCPEVYLDVVPIGRAAGRLRVGAAGPPLEWAVKMRQLPQEDMLPARLAAGTVTAPQIEGIAGILAAFHAATATGRRSPGYGTPEAVSRNVEENFTQTEQRTGRELPLEHLNAARAYARRFLADHRELFLARDREGRIREGHGDLRAQNICLHAGVGGGVQILDCIEFNERFRCGDVAADLAYLAMDLDLAGRTDLRQILVDRYVTASGDEGLLPILVYYACYRAYVRGKIALLAVEELEIPASERDRQRDLAAAAFDLARSYAAARGQPALWITVGFSGSGKSLLAYELSRRLPAVRLSSDVLRKELAGVPICSSLPPEEYTAERRQAVYEELRRRAGQRLAQGHHVILDGTFLKEQEREAARLLASGRGAEFWVVQCECPEQVIRERLRERAAAPGASDAGVAVYETQRRSAEARTALRHSPSPGWISVRTDAPSAHAAREVLGAYW